MGWQRGARTKIEDAVRLEETFSHTSASGERYPRAPFQVGKLNQDMVEKFRADEAEPGIRFVVLSYATPIGWVTEDGVKFVVPQHFSQTTSQIQALVRAEWGCNREGYEV